MGIFKHHKKLSTNTRSNGAKLITASNPKDPISEQFRTIRTNIDFSSVDRDLKTVLFTSADVSEGKSTVSANMAVIWAQQGKRVLFVDADLRRSTLHTTFGLVNTKGLTTYLAQGADYHELLGNSGIENLTILTSGPVPPNPAELLNSKRMKDFLANSQNEFDIVMLDVPPLLSVTDTQVLSAEVDGVVLIVRQGITQKAAVQRSVELLKMVNAKVLGYVLNDVSAHSGYGYGYGYK